MANQADNYFRIDFKQETTKEEIAEFMEFFTPENLHRIYDLYVDCYDEDIKMIRGNVISAWSEPYESYLKLVTKFSFIERLRNICIEEGCDYYSILKFERDEKEDIEKCFEIVSV